MSGHVIQWAAPSPLWNGRDPERMKRPALLRFASDSFMDDLTATLGRDPGELARLEAVAESFRARPIGKPAQWSPPGPATGLKLYQPIHGHFYLLAAGLVCRRTGLPDHVVQLAQRERVGFVLRRLGKAGELAWCTGPGRPGWRAVPDTELAPFEELLPMSPVAFTEGGRRRRLFVGLVPTASRETYPAAPTASPYPPLDPSGKPVDSRPQELDARVIRPLRALIGASAPADASRFLVLDFADFLNARLPQALWTAIKQGVRPAPGAGRTLYDLLDQRVDPAAPLLWREALAQAWDQRDRITGEDPTAPTLAVDVTRSNLLPADRRQDATVGLRPAVLGALPSAAAGVSDVVEGEAPASVEVPKLVRVPSLDGGAEARYVLRCAYRRPACGALAPDVVSAPSPAFTLSAFLDPDAPQRPIRISLPADTSIRDLRKYRRNVSFLLSRELREQMNRVSHLRDMVNNNLDDAQSFDFGVICSFSIPIITICALIVLLIFVSLLNIIFWWLPFFRICFPILRAR